MDRTSGNVRVVFGSNYPSLVSALVPASVCGFSHLYLVTADIALQETPCSVCVETRATALQVSHVTNYLNYLNSWDRIVVFGICIW